ncbi:hypothetical protein [Chroococcidiopsis sp.]|uniref:hypothetical protein n=1 Tax=Chroococcidiopsis sp. TaxID=3088168 RepID=UPI003F2A2DD9
MIHDSAENYVFPNTTDKEIPHISIDRYLELQAENRLLRQEISRLSQHNEVLHNCWVYEKQKYLDAAGVIRARAIGAKILPETSLELESHLNPGEVA